MHATVTKIKHRTEPPPPPFNNKSWGGDQEIFVEIQRKVLMSKGTAGYWEEICRWAQSICAVRMPRTTHATCSSGNLCAAPRNCLSQLRHPRCGEGDAQPSDYNTSGDNEDKRLQPHHFRITNDDLHFKGLLPTCAPAVSAQQGHGDLRRML